MLNNSSIYISSKTMAISATMEPPKTPESPQFSIGLNIAPSHDDDGSVDSNFDPEIPTIMSVGSLDALESAISTRFSSKVSAIGASAATTTASVGGAVVEKYNAATIRAEFKKYQSVLPRPDKLLQEKHSFATLRNIIKTSEKDGAELLPRFLKYNHEGGVKPHHALMVLLLSEWDAGVQKSTFGTRLGEFVAQALSFGALHRQLNNPAEFIRDQFYRVAPIIPVGRVSAAGLRKMIANRGMTVPNYFLDPDDPKQFPPHIALLVMLQDGEKESAHFSSYLNWLAFSLFAYIALLLRIILEVVGGAGAIWGGAEVVKLRNADNAELWRWISIGIGVLCFLRFVTLNVPQVEDARGILGPAGPWSMRLPGRLRAVCDHPFHYFVRALPPASPMKKKNKTKEK